MSYYVDTPAMSESSRPIRMLIPLCLAAAAFLLVAPEARAHDPPPQSASASSDTVTVAPPTGEKEADRASILVALEAVRPDGTVQFAPGTYLVGELIRVTTSDVTLLGHPNGTTLRGCHPGAFVEIMVALFACNGLELAGGRQTVRDLTFEYAWHGLFIGCCFPSDLAALEAGDGPPHRLDQPGGHLIEGNTFRNSSNGMRVVGRSAEPIVIRGNRFINTFHALVINGGTAHFLDNDVSTPNPAEVPIQRRNGGAIIVMPDAPVRECGENIIAGNHIVDYADAILIYVADPDARCERNVIRANTIVVRRSPLGSRRHAITMGSPSDTTVVGIPLAITNRVPAGESSPNGAGVEGHAVVGDHLIEGNRIIGADGLGIEIRGSSGNRIVENHLSSIEERDPFPGNTTHSMDPEGWRGANGSGIWLSRGSDDNEILGNTFEDIASYALVIEGDSNRVILQNASDGVRDLGRGNRVSGPGGEPAEAPKRSAAEPDEPPYESKFVEAGGVRLHYLDFGGEGLPVVFVHSEAWDAHTYAEFAPRFADRSRVLAITRPGYGESEAHPDGFGVATQARALVDFLDALGIERAVFAGNASATAELTFLGEHHPDRVAGLVYFTGLAVPWLEEHHADPTRAFEMFRRASPGAGDVAERVRARTEYRPEHADVDEQTIRVPALAFVARSGTKGSEQGIGALALVGSPLMDDVRSRMPPSPARDYLERLATDRDFRDQQLGQITDPEAREYFIRLADDAALQERILRYHEEVVEPALRAGQERFRRAFGENLQLVPLDLAQVVGYEYRDSPELIEPHIRRFLADLEPIAVSSRDTIRHTVIVAGQPAGERLSWAESPGTWRYSARGPPSGFARTSRLTLDSEGLTFQMEISGRKNPMQPWEERFHLHAGRATWSTPVDRGELSLFGPAYYAAIHPAHDLGVLARALLRLSAGVMPLLPAGEARLEPLETRLVEVDGRNRTIRLYAIHGLDLRPRYVWLDEEEATFADEWSVLAGWEAAYPELRAAMGGAIAEHMRRMARDLAPPARERPLVIRGARLFDPETHAVHSGKTIVVEGSRILAVGPDGALHIPADAQLVDATGRMVLPGLWDMHAHQDPGRYLEWYVPLHLAAGVTTTRDMGSDASTLVSLRQRIDADEVVGPRIIMAGFIDGIGGSRTGIQVENAADVLAAVDRYAELGFVQLKIYNRLPADLVPVAIERAKHHRMRVSGHIPWEMTGREAVENGFDEIQHMTALMEGMVLDPDEDLTDSEIADVLAGLTPESEVVREFIELLAAHDVAVDPTLAFFHSTGAVPPSWIAEVLDQFPPQARRRWLDRSAPRWAGERWSEILANQFGIVRALHQAGVPILPGTDMMPGFGLHKELELYVEAGIPAPDVLTLATLGAARLMGMDDELGSIEPGKLADLILVDGDPTHDISDIRRVVTVIKDGRVYDPAAIYRALGIRPCCEREPVEVRP
jgi:pimeloyl-ACP methyl ester carboxylesterase